MLQEISYKIPFIGLKDGIHNYEFLADNTFFSDFEGLAALAADVKFNVELEKLPTLMNLEIIVSGSLELNCDRCGSSLTKSVEEDYRVIVKYGDETSDLIDDVIVLGPGEHDIILDQLFYEFTVLSLPQRNTHEEIKDCDEKAIQALQKFELKEKENIDPRWDKLKDLK